MRGDDRHALKLAAFLWLGCMTLSAVSITIAQWARTGEGFQAAPAWAYVWILSLPFAALPLSFCLYQLMSRLAGRPLMVRSFALVLPVMAAAILQALYDHQSGTFIASVFGAPSLGPITGQALAANFVNYFSLYVLYVCMVELGTLRGRAARYAQQGAEARELARKAQLELLWFQLNPHFLFNTLNNVISLVVGDRRDQATVMLRRLSTYLRATLDLNGSAVLSLENEMAAVEAYAEIEAVRFDRPLELDVDYPTELRQALVPALILLPLVENAVKYAVAPSRGRATIRVKAWRSDQAGEKRLWIEVLDSGLSGKDCAPVPSGTGLGLRNVTERLAAQYADAASLEAGPAAGGFRVRLHLPLSMGVH